MQSGEYDCFIRLYRMVRTKLASGEVIDTPTYYADAWAKRAPLRGTERWVANQMAATVDERFIIRWRPNLNPVCELEYNGSRYEITSVTELGRMDRYEILATARASKTAVPT